jgi:zinc transport system ATP-binding protein
LRLFGPRAADAVAVYQHHHDHTHLPDGRVVPLEAAQSEHKSSADVPPDGRPDV